MGKFLQVSRAHSIDNTSASLSGVTERLGASPDSVRREDAPRVKGSTGVEALGYFGGSQPEVAIVY
jgi:hypothetical protein